MDAIDRSSADLGSRASQPANRSPHQLMPPMRTVGTTPRCHSSAASADHHSRPPHTAATTMTAATLVATRARRRRRASASSPGGRTLSRTAAPMIVSRPTPRNIPSAASTNPSRAIHRTFGSCQREHGNDGGALTRRTIDDDEHLIRRRRHEPELGGIELRVAGNGRRRFGRRGACPPDVPLSRAHGDVIRIGSRRAVDTNRDGRAARDDARQPHADPHAIRHRPRRRRTCRGCRHAPSTASASRTTSDARAAHRCTRAIQLPHQRPHRADANADGDRDGSADEEVVGAFSVYQRRCASAST